MIEPEVTFNMDLANGPTTERFCYAAAAVLGMELSEEDQKILADPDAYELTTEVWESWNTKLDSAGYCVIWNAGDVVVYDLRPLSEDEREEFYHESENW